MGIAWLDPSLETLCSPTTTWLMKVMDLGRQEAQIWNNFERRGQGLKLLTSLWSCEIDGIWGFNLRTIMLDIFCSSHLEFAMILPQIHRNGSSYFSSLGCGLFSQLSRWKENLHCGAVTPFLPSETRWRTFFFLKRQWGILRSELEVVQYSLFPLFSELKRNRNKHSCSNSQSMEQRWLNCSPDLCQNVWEGIFRGQS